MTEYFDLNIEKVLEHWSLSFAVREFISNALDEQTLTKTNEIEIFKILNVWHIRDYGRGISMKHFSQNENQEKLSATNLIGKFGVGLKDALAVLDRNNIRVQIVSRYCNVSIEKHKKSNFDMETLHAVFDSNIDDSFVGTDIRLFSIGGEVIEEAKSFFLHFNSKSLLEKTKNGEVHMCIGTPKIYVNGLQIAEEENFMFSYNITNVSASLRKAMNRERSNVGRTAYTESIKSILLKTKSQAVLDSLIKDLKNFTMGNQKDESTWNDVASYTAKTLNKIGKYLFISAFRPLDNNQLEIAKTTGREIVVLPEDILYKLGNEIYTFQNAVDEYEDSFEFEEVPISDFTKKELYALTFIPKIRKFYKENTKHRELPQVKIVKTLGLTNMAQGLWYMDQIWIDRKTLTHVRKFVECVIHEYAHSLSDNPDNSRAFETDLGELFSYFAYELLLRTEINE